jgi:hypothetical protein
MGGMFTILKVRENPGAADVAGWYEHPQGSIAVRADAARLAEDGIDVNAKPS